MNDNEITENKLLEQAVNSLREEDPEALPEWEEDLRQGAWQILHDDPGRGKENWMYQILRQYPLEAVDTFGIERTGNDIGIHEVSRIYSRLYIWWDSETYEDEVTGICETYEGWSQVFATAKSVMVYDQLAGLQAKLSDLTAQKRKG